MVDNAFDCHLPSSSFNIERIVTEIDSIDLFCQIGLLFMTHTMVLFINVVLKKIQ